jgi:putative ABC transport system ATP-binding protein
VIHLSHVEKSYPDGEGARVRVLSQADLEVGSGEFVAVTGPSGCGKTTLLNIVGGLDTDYQGDVRVADVSLPGLSDRALAHFRNRTVGFVFQSFNLVPPLTALENVKLPSFFADDGGADLDARAAAALARVGLEAKASRRPAELSGGERQRVAIARALFAQPKLLLCDEPTGNLDVHTGGEIVDLFRVLNTEGLTILVVTHEERMWRAAKRVIQLREGKLAPVEAVA